MIGGIISEMYGGSFSQGAIIAAASAAASMGLNSLAKTSQGIDRQGTVGEGADRRAQADLEVSQVEKATNASKPTVKSSNSGVIKAIKFLFDNMWDLQTPVGSYSGTVIEANPTPEKTWSWWKCGVERARCGMKAHFEWEFCMKGTSRAYDLLKTMMNQCFKDVIERQNICRGYVDSRCR